jgi:hypothetical protein
MRCLKVRLARIDVARHVLMAMAGFSRIIRSVIAHLRGAGTMT